MAYDRYIASCHPLHCQVIMSMRICVQVIAGPWISSFVYSALHTVNIFRISFCGSNGVGQFFCNISGLLKLSCSDTSFNEITIMACGVLFGLTGIVSIFLSYIHILSTVLKIPSIKGKYKAFSTCLPHLIVFWLFFSTGMFTYMRSGPRSSPYQDILASVLYSVVSPVMNPFIYSLRNKEIKEGFGKILRNVHFTKRTYWFPKQTFFDRKLLWLIYSIRSSQYVAIIG